MKRKIMRKMNDLVSPNEQELAQGGLAIQDEESLVQVRGGVSPGKGLMKAINIIQSRAPTFRTPDLNLTPVQARRPQSPPPSPASSGNDLGDELSPSSVLHRYLNSNEEAP
jgi:hypothetical protein